MEAVPEEEAVGDNTNAVSLKGQCLVQLGVPMASVYRVAFFASH